MNNSRPLISIIIPVYNAEPSIGRCIDSLLVQTLDDFEIIAVDDGSSDGSLAVLEDYVRRDGRIRVLSPGHGGVSAARNHGIDAASGRWLTFVDADDYVGPDYLSDLYDESEGSQMSICGYSVVNPGKEPEAVDVVTAPLRLDSNGLCPLDDVLVGFTMYCLGFVWAKLFRTEIVKREALRFDEGISFGEDGIFVFTYFRYVTTVHVSFSSDYFYVRSADDSTLSMVATLDKRIKGINSFFDCAVKLVKSDCSSLVRDKIERHYLDGLLTTLRMHYSMEEPVLSKEECNDCYRKIRHLISPHNYRPLMPVFLICVEHLNYGLYMKSCIDGFIYSPLSLNTRAK